ncbi:MAG: hypothetical protein ACOX0W_02060 [Sphaerochaetaceae bacterium]|jgi:hypothetical protein
MTKMMDKNLSQTKIITCASYYGTGSSAIGDIVSEFDSVTYTSDYEANFLHCMYGVSDLEYYLIDNPHRHNSSLALKNFIRLAYATSGNSLFKKNAHYFNNEWDTHVAEYVRSLYAFSYHSVSFFDSIWLPRWMYYAMQILKKIFKINFLKNSKHYSTIINREEFLKATRTFVSKLLSSLHIKTEFVYIDQFFPSSHIDQVSQYVESPVFTFIVDRDPRDLYLLDKYVWKTHMVPTDSAEGFCSWFRKNRITQSQEIQQDNVLLIKFEDLIYKYDKTIQNIISFCGLSLQDRRRHEKSFDPHKSINNTRLWEMYPESFDDMNYIERELSEYIYPYTEDDVKLFGSIVSDQRTPSSIF